MDEPYCSCWMDSETSSKYVCISIREILQLKFMVNYLVSVASLMQEYSQMWVEVNFTVSAYDELKMCKSRTQAIDPFEYLENPMLKFNSNLIISKYEVRNSNTIKQARK